MDSVQSNEDPDLISGMPRPGQDVDKNPALLHPPCILLGHILILLVFLIFLHPRSPHCPEVELVYQSE